MYVAYIFGGLISIIRVFYATVTQYKTEVNALTLDYAKSKNRMRTVILKDKAKQKKFPLLEEFSSFYEASQAFTVAYIFSLILYLNIQSLRFMYKKKTCANAKVIKKIKQANKLNAKRSFSCIDS